MTTLDDSINPETLAAKPKWLQIAETFIGEREISGPKHNPKIVKLWADINMRGIKTDEVPWCAAFVGAMLERAGIPSTDSGAALSYAKWGQPLDRPVLGCIAVFVRKGGGHVGFVVGETADKKSIFVLGGNQSDSVKISKFPLTNLKGYRWPKDTDEEEQILPIMSSAGDYETKVV